VRARAVVVVLLLALFAALAADVQAQTTTPNGSDQPSAARALIQKFSPIVMLRKQEDPPCDVNEEQFEPTTVHTVLGNPNVTLVRIKDKKKKDIKTAPTANDIAGLPGFYYLDLPGDPITSDCVYARDFAALKAAGKAPLITYVRIAGQTGHDGLVVQYWFFYYFNQFNDLHEGDWEGLQLVFDDAKTPLQALVSTGPDQIALFQHGGGETADWEDDKVQKQGDHPIVYSAAGSHATFYDDAVYLQTGQNGAGLGCDNTTEPLRAVRPHPVLIPTTPTLNGPENWLTYYGHWGQKEKGFNNGPTGPITKQVWKEPFTWLDRARLASPTLPGGGVFGGAATSAFCETVAAVSVFINAQSKSPTGVLLIVAILLALFLLPLVITRWWPVDIGVLRRTRAFGQIMRGARQIYGRDWRAFLPIALSALPLIVVIEGVQYVYTQIVGQRDVHPAIKLGGLRLDFSLTISGTFRPVVFAIVAAAAIAGMRMLDRGQRPTFTGAWRLTGQRLWRLIGADLTVTVLLTLLAISLIGLPYALYKFFAWQLVQQQIIFEDKGIRAALRDSTKLVRKHWFRTARTTGFLVFLTLATGPVLGFVLIFLNLSLFWVNAISTIVYMLLVPFEAIGRTLLYFDLKERVQEQPEVAPGEAAPSPAPG
jgi:hypothetical protein